MNVQVKECSGWESCQRLRSSRSKGRRDAEFERRPLEAVQRSIKTLCAQKPEASMELAECAQQRSSTLSLIVASSQLYDLDLRTAGILSFSHRISIHVLAVRHSLFYIHTI